MQTLPDELLLLVASFLPLKKHYIPLCLVSKRFLDIYQPLLFDCITDSELEYSQDLFQLVCCSTLGIKRGKQVHHVHFDCRTHLAALEDRHPSRTDWSAHEIKIARMNAESYFKGVMTFLHMCPNLQSLTVEFAFEKEPDAYDDQSRNHVDHLGQSIYSHTVVPETEDWITLPCLASSLTHLAFLTYDNSRPASGAMADLILASARLNKLSLEGVSVGMLEDCMRERLGSQKDLSASTVKVLQWNADRQHHLDPASYLTDILPLLELFPFVETLHTNCVNVPAEDLIHHSKVRNGQAIKHLSYQPLHQEDINPGALNAICLSFPALEVLNLQACCYFNKDAPVLDGDGLAARYPDPFNQDTAVFHQLRKLNLTITGANTDMRLGRMRAIPTSMLDKHLFPRLQHISLEIPFYAPTGREPDTPLPLQWINRAKEWLNQAIGTVAVTLVIGHSGHRLYSEGPKLHRCCLSQSLDGERVLSGCWRRQDDAVITTLLL